MKNSRRSFLKKSAITMGGITVIPRHVLGKGLMLTILLVVLKQLFLEDVASQVQ